MALRLSRKPATLALLMCGLAAAGCSFPMHSLLSKDDLDVEQTGSIARPAALPEQAPPPSDGDLAYARAAAADLLARGGKDSSAPWKNPETGAGGNVMQLATSHTEDGLACRDLLVSYVRGESQDWLQGAACRSAAGNWEIKRLKPLSQS